MERKCLFCKGDAYTSPTVNSVSTFSRATSSSVSLATQIRGFLEFRKGCFPCSRVSIRFHTVATGSSGHLGVYRIETQVTAGNGKLTLSGVGCNTTAKESIKVGFDYFKANASSVSASAKPGDHNFHLHVVELQNTGPTTAMTLATFVALCSGILGKSVQSQMVVLGSMSLGGSVVPVENLVLALFAVGNVNVSLCKKSAYAPFSARRRS